MINKKAFEQLRKEFEQYEKKREEVITISRQILKLSKSAVYDVQRQDLKNATQKLNEAKTLVKKMQTKEGRHTGACGEASEEYAEAYCFATFMKEKRLSTITEVSVDTNSYLGGICDLAGELVRMAITASIKENYALTLEIKEFLTRLHAELMLFDFPNIPVRRKFDAIKYGLEKLEDLTLKLKLEGKI